MAIIKILGIMGSSESCPPERRQETRCGSIIETDVEGRARGSDRPKNMSARSREEIKVFLFGPNLCNRERAEGGGVF